MEVSVLTHALIVMWIVGNAHDPEKLQSPPEEMGALRVQFVTREDGTRQWRFSHPRNPGDEIIVAAFQSGIGFPVHFHQHEELFLFLSPGIWTQGDKSWEVQNGSVATTRPNEQHGWQPMSGSLGLMVVYKKAPSLF